MKSTIYSDVSELTDLINGMARSFSQSNVPVPSGICGFDGFIDTFIRMESPESMAAFGPKVAEAAGIAASYTSQHQGDKFGGNGPLLTAALSDLHQAEIDLHYIGALGDPEVLPIYQQALGAKTTQLYTLAQPAHSDCLEFTDGKVMLCDLRTCSDITWERLIERVGLERIDQLLLAADFVAAVNWGKLPYVGGIWKQLALRHQALGRPAKQLVFFMDLAEFEQRPAQDREDLIRLVAEISQHCRTMLSLNLKEAWQLAESFGGEFRGQKAPAQVAELAGFLRTNVAADRIIIHPNDGAACASAEGLSYVPGPYCREPLISTGAGDNFGAGCIAAALMGLDDAGMLLLGNCTSGYFVRSGKTPGKAQVINFLKAWQDGSLQERL
ncbi:PfkB family carbohydrate kinase [Coraliomargarita sp. SDUM461003]|uniref:PfkB family carbohydrate kinase n=1 Tax=Thalassobacterium maritimum TaxID=3041265 RepID=A0ABU1AWH1_9BACT|nr:PfkB family carbohydrate kinase [Coraliomargarita sp. SDUM461003]MDQ8208431.1 PfkB family carbohydrate kinase [Coraliomargarita sp. SDUM461003]